MTAEISDLLACPRCDKSPLSPTDSNALRCDACKINFPAVSDIPWLFAEPDATLGEWRNRLHFLLQQLADESQRIGNELKNDNLGKLTRKRLELRRTATDEHRDGLRQILAPIDIQSLQASYESYLALRTRLPIDQGIQTYYSNIHRDWAWGDDENAASVDLIKRVAGDKPLGSTLVLGAGACRLAYDIHRQMKPGRTIALDFNPLLLLVAQAVMRGDKPEYYEFPMAPRTLEDAAVKRTLSAPELVDENFHLVFGDALRPPFVTKRFDTVITPWLIDIISDDLPNQAARINNLLQDEGRWINFGSLAFDHPVRRRRYSTEETLEIVEEHGFEKPESIEETIPYMCSPASRHGRQESVFTFAATKNKKVKAPARHKALPDWIVTGKEPVPLTQSFKNQAMSTQIYSYIMSLINGKRTIGDIAAMLEQQKLMTKAEAEPAIRTFLTRMYDDSQRNSGF